MRSRPMLPHCGRDKLAPVADQGDLDSAVRPSPGGAARFLPLVAGLGAGAVFLPALANGFIDWDDGSLLLRYPWYRSFGPSNLAWMFTTIHR